MNRTTLVRSHVGGHPFSMYAIRGGGGGVVLWVRSKGQFIVTMTSCCVKRRGHKESFFKKKLTTLTSNRKADWSWFDFDKQMVWEGFFRVWDFPNPLRIVKTYRSQSYRVKSTHATYSEFPMLLCAVMRPKRRFCSEGFAPNGEGPFAHGESGDHFHHWPWWLDACF